MSVVKDGAGQEHRRSQNHGKDRRGPPPGRQPLREDRNDRPEYERGSEQISSPDSHTHSVTTARIVIADQTIYWDGVVGAWAARNAVSVSRCRAYAERPAGVMA